MEFLREIKKINNCIIGGSDSEWRYEIIYKKKSLKYRADLWGYDRYDGYLAQWKIYESSPDFDTEQEAKAYAEKEWVV